jgi:hypothetical protein
MSRLLMLTLALAFAAASWAQPPRCWKNEQGVTECGPRPPPGVQARDVRVPRAAETPEPVREAEAFADADLDAEEAQRLAIQRRHCDLAREQLAALERSDILYERGPQGERRVLDDDEAAAAREQARQDVATRCAGLPDE